MLVLSRKENETIIIRVGDTNVAVQVLAIHGNRVAIGVDAPQKVKILREELCLQGDAE